MAFVNWAEVFNKELYIDVVIRKWLLGISSPATDKFFVLITQLGSPFTIILLSFLVLIFLLCKKKWREGIFVNICSISAWGAMEFLKSIFQRPRPVGEALTAASGYSFPSGHAMVSIAFYGFIAYLAATNIKHRMGRLITGGLYLLVFLIGLSRVYLNVHYASDVLAGFVFGLIILLLAIQAFKGRVAKR